MLKAQTQIDLVRIDDGAVGKSAYEIWLEAGNTGTLEEYLESLNGTDGKGIQSTSITYQAHSNGTSAPTGTWETSPPQTTADKPYMWTKTVITYTDDQSSTVYSVGATPEGLQANINAVDGRVTSVETTANNANTKIDNLKIGGRNLISHLSTNWQSGNWSSPAVGSESVLGAFEGRISLLNPIEITPNTDYWIKIYTDKTAYVLFRQLDANNKYLRTTSAITDRNFFAPSDCRSIVVTIYDNIAIEDLESGAIKVKLEKGNKATDWTPAPEDINNKVDELQEQNTEQIAQDLIDLAETLTASAEEIMSSSLQGYATTEALNNEKETLIDALNLQEQDLDDKISALRGQVETLGGEVANQSNYLRIENANIIIGKTDSLFTSVFTNNSLEFRYNNIPIAWFNTNELVVKQLKIEAQITHFDDWAVRKGAYIDGVGYNLNDVWIGG